MLYKMQSWTVSGLYHIFRTKTVLRIPLPAKLSVFRTYIEDGDLCVVLRPLRDGREGGLVDSQTALNTGRRVGHNGEARPVENDGRRS